MQAALASSPAPDDPCSTKRWLFVFSVGGRTGSTTLMGMLNAVPQIKLTGENKDLYSRLYELEQDTLALGGGDRARDEFDAWHNAPDPVRLQAAVCSWLLALSPHPGALVHGFKEIRTPAAPLLARTMPHARFVINFRLDLAAQQRSFERLGGQKTLAEATKGNVSSWRKPIPFVLDELQRLRAALGGRPVFELPLERYGVTGFNALLRWVGARGCEYTRVLQANTNKTAGFDSAKAQAPGLLRGRCNLTAATWDASLGERLAPEWRGR